MSKHQNILEKRATYECLHRAKKWGKRLKRILKEDEIKNSMRKHENQSFRTELHTCLDGYMKCFDELFSLSAKVRKGDRRGKGL